MLCVHSTIYKKDKRGEGVYVFMCVYSTMLLKLILKVKWKMGGGRYMYSAQCI